MLKIGGSNGDWVAWAPHLHPGVAQLWFSSPPLPPLTPLPALHPGHLLCFPPCSSPVLQGGYLAARELDKAFVSFNGCTAPSPDMFYASLGGFDLLVYIHK